MRVEIVQDVRWVLIKKKRFSLRPEALEQYLYSLNLSQTAERVFWTHWHFGVLRGDFTSELSIREVARRCHCDSSSVTRAYQVLKALGLLRRQDPGRDPSRPFEQAIAVTEVLLPKAALQTLLQGRDRASNSARIDSAAAQSSAAPPQKPSPQSSPDALPKGGPPQPQSDPPLLNAWSQCLEQLRHDVPERDFQMWVRPLQPQPNGSTLTLYVPNSFALNWLRANLVERIHATLRDLIPELHAVKFTVGSRPIGNPLPAPTEAPQLPPGKPPARKLSVFMEALLKNRLSAISLGPQFQQLYRELLWSIEQGPLSKIDGSKAIHVGVKLIREGRWSRPNRMPPNWRRTHATPETCNAA